MIDGPAPIIVTATFAAADFAWLDGLRRAHFPPWRNHVPAHLTLFHHLPPSAAAEVVRRIKAETTGVPPPRATISGLIRLGGGVAFRVQSPGLETIRAQIAAAFQGMLTPQDGGGWRAHVTIQNKAERKDAEALYRQLEAEFAPRPLRIAGLAAWWYRGGPWEPLAETRFRG